MISDHTRGTMSAYPSSTMLPLKPNADGSYTKASFLTAGGVFTSDAGRAQRVAGRMRHGTVWINDFHPYVPQAEWGGMKRSGNGRELGVQGLEEYRETKHIWHNIDPKPQYWFPR